MTAVDETAFGTRDAKGHFVPDQGVDYGPLFEWPIRPVEILKWLVSFPGYLFPWNALYFGFAAAVWFLLTPSMSTMESFAPGWIAVVLGRNLVIVAGYYSLFHWRFHVRRSQGTRFKFNQRWPGHSRRFTFGNQTKDNVFWMLASGIPIVTAWEVVGLWLFANGHIGWLDWTRNPVWFVALMVLIPIWREFHFYCIHRLIHTPLLYKRVHALHHRNTNPGPLSGLAMHPVEHLVYFSSMAIHWIVPSHPLHMIYNQYHLLLSPVPGHAGFDRYETGGARSFNNGGYAHYLHHKYFEVNYADGVIPLDRWFGTFHDGSAEATANLRSKRSAAAVASID